MTIIDIKVSRFSRRIIEASRTAFVCASPTPQHQNPVYQIYEHDTLYLHLCNRRPRQRLHPGKLNADLPDTLSLMVSEAVAKNIAANGEAVGLYLNQIHRDELNQLLWWETRELHGDNCRLKATEVIAAFCKRFGIEPDVDIALEALNKSWTRYKQRMAVLLKKDGKNTAIFVKNEWQAVQRFSRKTQTKWAAQRLDNATLDATIDAYISQNQRPHFLTIKNQPRAKRKVQLQLYVYNVVGGRPMKLCAERFDIKLKNAYDHVTAFQSFLRHAPPIILADPLSIKPAKNIKTSVASV